jgi:SAM-dependent methyltransferase
MAYEELKQRQSVMWGNGPYQRITDTLTDIHDVVIERLAPGAGDRWLDLACGTGAIAERAAAAGASVMGLDLAPVLIETAKERAAERGLAIDYVVGDVERLELPDASFDKVSSTCGIMFAPDHEAAARELARVTAPGGRIALANWTPTGGLAKMFEVMAPYQPAPPAEQPVRLGRRGPRPRAARRDVRAGAPGGRLHAAHAVRRGVLGALLDELRPDEDAGRVARRAPRGAAPRLGRFLRDELPDERRDRAPARVSARARDAGCGDGCLTSGRPERHA